MCKKTVLSVVIFSTFAQFSTSLTNGSLSKVLSFHCATAISKKSLKAVREHSSYTVLRKRKHLAAQQELLQWNHWRQIAHILRGMVLREFHKQSSAGSVALLQTCGVLSHCRFARFTGTLQTLHCDKRHTAF